MWSAPLYSGERSSASTERLNSLSTAKRSTAEKTGRDMLGKARRLGPDVRSMTTAYRNEDLLPQRNFLTEAGGGRWRFLCASSTVRYLIHSNQDNLTMQANASSTTEIASMTDTASVTDTPPRRAPSEGPGDSGQKSDQDGENTPEEAGAVPALANCVEAIEEDTQPQEQSADEQSTESVSSTPPRYVYD